MRLPRRYRSCLAMTFNLAIGKELVIASTAKQSPILDKIRKEYKNHRDLKEKLYSANTL